jgi:hypothetical protein
LGFGAEATGPIGAEAPTATGVSALAPNDQDSGTLAHAVELRDLLEEGQGRMSPTIFCAGDLRFYFFSREEERPHVHVQGPSGEAKFWLDPEIELAANYGLRPQALKKAQRLIGEREHEIRDAWAKHFQG